jgi:hypothetical protein
MHENASQSIKKTAKDDIEVCELNQIIRLFDNHPGTCQPEEHPKCGRKVRVASGISKVGQIEDFRSPRWEEMTDRIDNWETNIAFSSVNSSRWQQITRNASLKPHGQICTGHMLRYRGVHESYPAVFSFCSGEMSFIFVSR